MTPEQERVEARIEFGCYVNIEQHRYGVTNEIYRYKVIGRMRSNSYVNVPVHSVDGETLHDELVEVIACICCGVNETKVQKFRIEDVRLVSLDREEQLQTKLSQSNNLLAYKNRDIENLESKVAEQDKEIQQLKKDYSELEDQAATWREESGN